MITPDSTDKATAAAGNAVAEFTQTFFLSAGEANAQQEMSLPALTSRIIDIATAHANSLGIGNPAMEARGCGWVLSRLAIEMSRYPKVNETYSVTTWIESWNRHFSVRDFMIADADGTPVGYAVSVWMVLDTRTRENAGLSHLSLPDCMVSSRKCPAGRPGRHPVVVAAAHVDPLPCGSVRATAPGVVRTFGYADLDFYRHVNTVRYVTMLLNRFSLREMDETQINRLDMAFMREGRYDEPVTVLRADSGLHTVLSMADCADGTPLLSASVSRLPRNLS